MRCLKLAFEQGDESGTEPGLSAIGVIFNFSILKFFVPPRKKGGIDA